MTMIVFASSTCLGFATQGEINLPIPETDNSITEQGETIDDETTPVPPVLEKCKKKKK